MITNKKQEKEKKHAMQSKKAAEVLWPRRQKGRSSARNVEISIRRDAGRHDASADKKQAHAKPHAPQGPYMCCWRSWGAIMWEWTMPGMEEGMAIELGMVPMEGMLPMGGMLTIW